MTQRHPPLPDPHLEEVAEWHPIEGTPMKKKVAIGCSIGATIETYDFIGYGTAAALYFNDAFFPASDPLSGTLFSFATLGIGLAARPLGGIIRGIPGAPRGRRNHRRTRGARSRPHAGAGRCPAADGDRDGAHRLPAHLPTCRSLGPD